MHVASQWPSSTSHALCSPHLRAPLRDIITVGRRTTASFVLVCMECHQCFFLPVKYNRIIPQKVICSIPSCLLCPLNVTFYNRQGRWTIAFWRFKSPPVLHGNSVYFLFCFLSFLFFFLTLTHSYSMELPLQDTSDFKRPGCLRPFTSFMPPSYPSAKWATAPSLSPVIGKVLRTPASQYWQLPV